MARPQNRIQQKAILIVLDGFGIGPDSPFNAIQNAEMPFYRQLIQRYPHAQLTTHGPAVGLPEGVMGNSEVGHMTLGSGRIIYQDLTRISNSVYDRSFFKNPVLRKTIQDGAAKTGRVHLMGLLSDAGVHSHTDHLYALLELCVELRVPHVSVHGFLDGRDTPPGTAKHYVTEFLKHPLVTRLTPHETQIELTSLAGRYWAMDRDQRWERVQKAYLTMTGQAPVSKATPVDAVEQAFTHGQTDEFFEPLLFSSTGAMQDGDSVIFYNYRSDRARELSHAVVDTEFAGFDRGKGFKPSSFAGMTQYELGLKAEIAYAPQNLKHLFGEWLEEHQLKQFRIAETEKYAHVTFFFNGGREKPYVGEERLLIPSPKDVATYDLRPEMSAFQVANEVSARIEKQAHDFYLMNFANADMIGHTGNYTAAIQAMEALDTCLAQVVGAGEKSGYHVLITADHGNAEEMCDSQGRIHTQHTLNPVPLIWVEPNSALAPKTARKPLKDGTLADIMPTLCDLMQLTIPNEVSGKSLV